MSEKFDLNSNDIRHDTQLVLPEIKNGQQIKDSLCYPGINLEKVENSLREIFIGSIYWDGIATKSNYPKGFRMESYLKAVDIDKSVGFEHLLIEDDSI